MVSRREFVGLTPLVAANLANVSSHAAGQLPGNPYAAVVNVRDTGAIGDGVTDDAAAIQRAIDTVSVTGGTVYFPRTSRAYRVASTLVLHSSITLLGDQSRILGVLRPSSEGGHVPTTLTTNGRPGFDENVTLIGLVFDGGWRRHSRRATESLSELAPTIKFEGVQHLRLVDCTITGHTSNFRQHYEHLFGALSIVGCRNVELQGCKLTNYDTEGIVILESDAVVIDGLTCDSPTSGWTPLHLWYCSDCTVTRCRFRNSSISGGSVINSCASDMTIENCVSVGGKGIDLSNELNTRPFVQRRISIRDCTILSVDYGLQRPSYSNQGRLQGLVVDGCFFQVDKHDRTGRGNGIRISDVEGCVLANNTILTTDQEGYAIALDGVTATRIHCNVAKASLFLRIAANHAQHVRDVTISENHVELYPLHTDSVDIEDSTFILVFNESSSTVVTLVDEIRISNNKVVGIEGAAINTVLNSPQTFGGGRVWIHANSLRSTVGARAGVVLQQFDGVDITDNAFHDVHGSIITRCVDVTITNNVTRFTDTNRHSPWQLEDISGYHQVDANRFTNANPALPTIVINDNP